MQSRPGLQQLKGKVELRVVGFDGDAQPCCHRPSELRKEIGLELGLKLCQKPSRKATTRVLGLGTLDLCLCRPFQGGGENATELCAAVAAVAILFVAVLGTPVDVCAYGKRLASPRCKPQPNAATDGAANSC